MCPSTTRIILVDCTRYQIIFIYRENLYGFLCTNKSMQHWGVVDQAMDSSTRFSNIVEVAMLTQLVCDTNNRTIPVNAMGGIQTHNLSIMYFVDTGKTFMPVPLYLYRSFTCIYISRIIHFSLYINLELMRLLCYILHYLCTINHI